MAYAENGREAETSTMGAGHHLLLEIRLTGPQDHELLQHVAPGVFDGPIDPRWTREFLADARHHLVVALDQGCVVGMVSAIHSVHPDKAPQLWINEVGVAPSHLRQGIGRQRLETMLEHGRALGCTEAWVGTEETNEPAQNLYRSAGGDVSFHGDRGQGVLIEVRVPAHDETHSHPAG